MARVRLANAAVGAVFVTMAMTFAAFAACSDGGEGGSSCTPGTDPEKGCGVADCQLGQNECGGAVYACDQNGRVLELGTCERSVSDAGLDGGAGGECLPGTDPVPGCGFRDCQLGKNSCGGQVFVCDMTGHVVSSGICDPPPPPPVNLDGGSGPIDAPRGMFPGAP
jgi:hypothetical protein